MTKLSVNVNKIATLRNARGGNSPDLLKVVADSESFGAYGITVHPRPDERHIRYSDVYDIKRLIKTEFNIEGNPTDKFCKLVLDVCPTQVTLVPDSPDVLTSNQGWDIKSNLEFLKEKICLFKEKGIRTSIFINPDEEVVRWAKETGCDRVELYTEPYAANYKIDREQAVYKYVKAAKVADELSIGLNAGHDLSLENLGFFVERIPNLLEVSIGHALICESLYMGLKKTIESYNNILNFKSELV